MACDVMMMVVMRMMMMLSFITLTQQKIITTNTNTTISGLEDSPLSEVIGVVGGRVVLPCNFDPSLSNDSTHLVLFYRSGIGTPIYSVDARGVGVELGSHWADGRLGGRAYVSLDKGHAGLVLEELKLNDKGHYRCRVDFVESPTRNTRITLKVIEPPSSISVTSDYSPTTSLGSIAGPFPEGAEVTLSCQVIGGDPRPLVSWWHVGSLLDDISEIQTDQVTRNSLTLPPLTRDDLNNTLTCQASNSNLTIPLSHHITIDMIYAPTWVELERGDDGDVVVQEGVARVITCEARGARPPARIQWILNGIALTSPSQDTVSGEVTRSSITFVGEPREHGLPLACLAFTPVNPLIHHTITSTATLLVLYKPRLQLRVDPHKNLQDVEEGEDVTFVCHIDAYPPVTGIQWAHDGVPIQMVDTDSPERLVLNGVSRNNSGGYTCAAANTEGARTSNTLTLRVKFAPMCQNGQQTVYGTARHEELHVPCDVLAHPQPSSFRWAVNTSTGIVDIALNLSSSVGTRSVVRYTPQTHHDFGQLLCWAVNDIGIQNKPCVFNVLPAAKPERVRDCHAERNNSMPASYVVLTCLGGWDGGINQTFTLEVRQAAKEEVLEAFRHAVQPFFIITGLQIGVEYRFTVTAANGRGSSVPVTVNYTATTIEADKVVSTHAHTHTIVSLTALLLVVSGVVALVACVSVAVIFFKRKGTHRSGKTQSAKKLCVGDSMKDNLEHNDVHTIVCVKDCEKEEVVKSYTPSGVVSNLYVTPSSLLNNRGMVAPQETDALLERPVCPPLSSLDSLGRCSNSTSKTSTSSTSSIATVALNPDFLARTQEYLLNNSNKQDTKPVYQDIRSVHQNTQPVQKNTHSVNQNSRSVYEETRSVLPDFIMQSLDRMTITPESPTKTCDCFVNGCDIIAMNYEYPAVNNEYMFRNTNCCRNENNYLTTNPTYVARCPDCVGRDEVTTLIPPHRESSV